MIHLYFGGKQARRGWCGWLATVSLQRAGLFHGCFFALDGRIQLGTGVFKVAG